MQKIQHTYIIGADECGRGSISHQIVICAVRAPIDWNLEGLKDSKKFGKNENKRFAMEEKLIQLANKGEIFFHIAERSHTIIDEIGLQVAQDECFYEAINKVYLDNSKIIIDGKTKFDRNRMPCDYESIEKADNKIPTVMAASIIAKTYRDRILINSHNEYPKYNWINNKGYANCNKHKQAIRELGLTPYHRQSFKIKLINN